MGKVRWLHNRRRLAKMVCRIRFPGFARPRRDSGIAVSEDDQANISHRADQDHGRNGESCGFHG